METASERMTVPDGTWRVGVIDYYNRHGKGGHGTHLAFWGLPRVKIVAVADPDEESRKWLQEETGAEKSYADWHELIERDAPDVICVCSRLPGFHKDVVVAAAKKGCHIYCEKPLAKSLEDADAMIDAAASAGILLSVAHLGRYAPQFQTARTMIQKGDIGRPLSIYCRGKEDHRGGGEDMLVLGTHLFDLSRFFLGDPEWVFGHITNDKGRKATYEDIKEPTEDVGPVVGDEILAVYGFKKGARVFFESRKGMYNGNIPRMGISVVGSEAAISFRYDAKRQLRIRRGRRPFEEGGKYSVIKTPYRLQIPGAAPLPFPVDNISGSKLYFACCNRCAALDLLHAIAERRDETLSSGHDGRWALEMAFGAYASHFNGCSLPMPLSNRRHPLTCVFHKPTTTFNITD